MCILFISLEENPKEGEFAVVIANNRDELWDRPTKPAGFWMNDSSCISGLDLTPGKEGGTWIGLSKTGRFASLLNILSANDDTNKKGRGYLVSDYLSQPVEEEESYVGGIHEESVLYNGFNLITMNIKSAPPTSADNRPGFQYSLTFLSNWKKFYSAPVQLPSTGVYGFGNCRHDKPWKKVEVGKRMFTDIVNRNRSKDKKENLIEELFEMLFDKTIHLPDEALETQGRHLPTDLRRQRAAINVWSPVYRYSSRTKTVILIDSEGRADYIEKTIKTPADTEQIEWITSRYSFLMHLSS